MEEKDAYAFNNFDYFKQIYTNFTWQLQSTCQMFVLDAAIGNAELGLLNSAFSHTVFSLLAHTTVYKCANKLH